MDTFAILHQINVRHGISEDASMSRYRYFQPHYHGIYYVLAPGHFGAETIRCRRLGAEGCVCIINLNTSASEIDYEITEYFKMF